jgi:putative DNA primase/helicase
MNKQFMKLEDWLKYYLQLLFSFFIIESYSKSAKKHWKEYQNRMPTQSELDQWVQRDPSNVVLVTGKVSNLFVVDLDSEEALQEFVNRFGSIDQTARVKTSNGYHLYYLNPDFEVRNRVGLLPNIDIRGEGGYVLAPPSIHPDGSQYHWVLTIQDAGGLKQAPMELLDLLRNKPALETESDEEFEERTTLSDEVKQFDAQKLIEKLIARLSKSVEGKRNKTLFAVSCELRRMATKHRLDIGAIESLLTETASTIGLDVREISETIRSAFARTEKDMATSVELSSALMQTSIKLNKKLKTILENMTLDGLEIDKYWANDTGNARLFSQLFKGNILYDHHEGQWYFRQGHIWKVDDEASVMVLGMLTTETRSFLAFKIEDIEKRDKHLKAAGKDKSRQKLNAMIDLAKTLPEISFDGKKWDRGKNLLPVKNGIVDLRTKAFVAIDDSLKFKNYVKISYNPNASASRWIQYLNEIFEGNQELINWIQQAVGYTISGETSEQIFFICHGNGSNGKSLFLRMIKRILGKFSHSASSTIFDGENRQNVSADVASIQGKRLVAISEISEGMILNETLIKQITSGDTLSARFLYQNPVEFDPECKLWFAVNHKPLIRDQSYGIWRRVLAIPFTAKFEGKTEDQRLEDKLIAEEEGILAWAIEGAYLWYVAKQNKLHLKSSLPAVVQAYTDDYRGESDPLVDFLADRIEIRTDLEIPANNLYKVYMNWADERILLQSERLSSKSFGEHFKQRFKTKRKSSGVYYLGLGVKEQFVHLLE